MDLNLVNFAETFEGTISGFEKYILPDNASKFTGTNDATTIEAAGNSAQIETGNGNDEIYSGGYNQVITTSAGDDTVYFNGGVSQFDLGEGSDILSYTTVETWQSGFGLVPDYGHNIFSSSDVISVVGKSKFASFVSGGAGTDTISLSNFADVIHIDGSDNADSFAALDESKSANRLDGVEVIEGLGGDDIIDLSSPFLADLLNGFTVDAGSGADTVFGSSNNDIINGGAGSDTIAAGPGDNIISGGAGSDVFIFSKLTNSDTVTDFDPSKDSIRILTTGSEKPSRGTIETLETGYKWQFGTSELTFNVSENLMVDSSEILISYTMI